MLRFDYLRNHKITVTKFWTRIEIVHFNFFPLSILSQGKNNQHGMGKLVQNVKKKKTNDQLADFKNGFNKYFKKCFFLI